MLEQESPTTKSVTTSFVPHTHPRRKSLLIRESLVDGFERGLVAREGLLAQGRGEAFDYLLGEKTGKAAMRAITVAAAYIVMANNPVISINGNVAALCPGQMVSLAQQIGAKLEVNLFYASSERADAIEAILKKHGAPTILGTSTTYSDTIPGVDSARRIVDKRGMLLADVVVVPLEDGDRTKALVNAGKKVITFDLNPLSRTSQTADVTIVDNVVRATKLLTAECIRLKTKDVKNLDKIIFDFDNKENLKESILQIRDNLEERMADA